MKTGNLSVLSKLTASALDKLQDNIMLNAFRIAINSSLTQFNMVDGIVDEYEDESGIDTINSLNESYNSTDDYYQPVTPALATSPYAHYKLNYVASSTTVPDNGTGANTGTASTNTTNLDTQGKVVAKFGTGAYFNGITAPNGSYISVPDSDDWTFGSDDFTIDFWANISDITSGNNGFVAQYDTGDQAKRWRFVHLTPPNNFIRFQATDNSGNTIAEYDFTSPGFQLNTWHHIALVRNGSNMYCFIDGIALSATVTTAIGTSSLPNLANAPLVIGASGIGGNLYSFRGTMEEFRISKGIARWTSNFTPPTSAYTSDTDTKLLLHLNGNLTDSGNTGHTATANNGLGFGGYDFDGSSEYISADAFCVATRGNTTGSISLWINYDNVGMLGTAIGWTLPGNNQTYALLEINDSAGGGLTSFTIWNNSVKINQIIFSTDIAPSGWNHIVITQNGVSIKAYLNGVEDTSATILGSTAGAWLSALTSHTVTNFTIGRLEVDTNQHYWDGKMDDLRYYQNKALTLYEIEAIYNAGNGTDADQPIADTKNMTLISDSFPAEVQPDSGRIVILEEDVDSITLNTDLKAYASRDGGSSYLQGTLVDEGNYDSSKRILVANFDFTQSGIGTGTNMEYKFETVNNKDLKLHATSLNWD